MGSAGRDDTRSIPARSEFTQSLTTKLIRRTSRYVGLIETSRDDVRATESDWLDKFEQYTGEVLEHFIPPGVRTRDSLVFAHLYAAEQEADGESNPTDYLEALLSAFMAAEVEDRGPLRLSRNQKLRLANLFQRYGRRLEGAALPLHAELAYSRAAQLHLDTGDHRARDQNLFDRARVRRIARDFGWAKVVDSLSLATCGFGYRPYRLLWWIVAQLVVFTALVWLVGGTTPGTALHLVSTGYLGRADYALSATLPSPIETLLVVEGYLGALSVSVFVVLLARRWLRP